MSRSYKKAVGCVDRSPWYKNYANKRIRSIPIKTEEDWVDPIPSHKGYTKYTCTYDICDYKWLYFNGFKELKRDRETSTSYWTGVQRIDISYTLEEIEREWRQYRNK